MPQFAANVSTLFTEVPFLDRFACAASAGFEAVECQYAYQHDANEIALRVHDLGLTFALMNAPSGDEPDGVTGLAALPGYQDKFRASVELAVSYAQAVGCPTIHLLAGNLHAGVDARAAMEVYLANLKWACCEFAELPITFVIEAINSRDRPRYFLNSPVDARAIIDAADEDNLGLLLDLYHCQIMEGDLSAQIEQSVSVTEHIQIAGVPGRHEPSHGEINYPFLFDQIDQSGYRGYVGCEYLPATSTESGLAWFAPYRRK